MCNDVQKQLEIDSVAISEHNNKQHLSEADQQGQGKGAKEEKVCVCFHHLHCIFSQDCSCLHRWYCITETRDTLCTESSIQLLLAHTALQDTEVRSHIR